MVQSNRERRHEKFHTSPVKRLFIAVEIPADAGLKRFIAELKKDLSAEKMRFTSLENLHITLKFLGDTPEERIPEIRRVMKEVSGSEDSFSFRLEGLGLFRNLKTPRVLWTGISSGEEFSRLKTGIESGLEPLGFPSDERVYNPHLTLARMKEIVDREQVKEILFKYRERVIMSCFAGKITLYESVLSREGGEYRVLGDFPLGQV